VFVFVFSKSANTIVLTIPIVCAELSASENPSSETILIFERPELRLEGLVGKFVIVKYWHSTSTQTESS
jgi:hypothetical protein